MPNDESNPRDPRAGLCADCRHVDVVRSPRSTFYRCLRSATDVRFPKYPRLPVLTCIGFEPEAARQRDAGSA